MKLQHNNGEHSLKKSLNKKHTHTHIYEQDNGIFVNTIYNETERQYHTQNCCVLLWEIVHSKIIVVILAIKRYIMKWIMSPIRILDLSVSALKENTFATLHLVLFSLLLLVFSSVSFQFIIMSSLIVIDDGFFFCSHQNRNEWSHNYTELIICLKWSFSKEKVVESRKHNAKNITHIREN